MTLQTRLDQRICQANGSKPTAVRAETGFEARATRLKLVTTTSIISVDEAHELRGAITVVIRWAEGPGGNVPATTEDQEIGEGCSRCLRRSGKYAEDRRVNVIPRDTANVDEFLESVFIWDVAVDNVSNASSLTAVCYVAYFPCHATTSNGVCSCLQTKCFPPTL